MQQYTERLGTAPLTRLLIVLSLPGIVSSITTSLYNIVDTIWVGQVGHEAIAALTIVFPYQILFYAIGGGTGIGISALVSRRFGEKNIDATNRVAGQIFFISAFWGTVFLLIAVFFADPILIFIGATPDIMDYARQYLVITSYGAPLMILSMLVSALIRGSGDAIKPMIIMVVGTIVNIILDPLLILGIGPFPELKVVGAALATLIAQSCGAFLGLYFLFAKNTAYHIKPAQVMPSFRIIIDIYHVGAPASVLQIAESFAFMLYNIAVSSFGSVAIAAMGIAMRISDFAFMPVMGVSHGLLPIVGYCFGEGNYRRLWEALKKATTGIAIFLAIATVAMEVLAPQILGIFTREEDLLNVGVPAFRIMMASITLVGPSMMIITMFQGLGRGKTALILSLIRQFIVFVPLLYLFKYLFGLTGIWVTMPVSDAVGFVISLLFILLEYRRHRKAGLLWQPTDSSGNR